MRIINAAYDRGEAGIWQPAGADDARRRSRREIAAGEIAVAAPRTTRIVGCVRVRRLDDETAEFGLLASTPSASGTGVGRALVDFAEQRPRTST